MLLFIAFVCFALLFAGWIVAPNTSPSAPERSPEPVSVATDPAGSLA